LLWQQHAAHDRSLHLLVLLLSLTLHLTLTLQ
jgi:hypothetical protein